MQQFCLQLNQQVQVIYNNKRRDVRPNQSQKAKSTIDVANLLELQVHEEKAHEVHAHEEELQQNYNMLYEFPREEKNMS